MGIAICIRRFRVQMGIVQSLTVCILLYGDLDHQIHVCTNMHMGIPVDLRWHMGMYR